MRSIRRTRSPDPMPTSLDKELNHCSGTVVRRSSEEWAVWLRNDEDVGVFCAGIAFLLLEVKPRRDCCGKTCSRFRAWGRGSARSAARALMMTNCSATTCQFGRQQTCSTVH